MIVGAIVYYWTKEFYLEQTKEALLNNIELLSFEIQKEQNLDALAKKVKEKLHIRITLISKDGQVVAESHKNKTKMDNHKYRDEILQADKESFGTKIRHSKTIDRDFLYVAKKYSLKEKTMYIRLSKELKSINEQIISLGVKILAVIALFFLTIFFIAFKLVKR